MSERIAVYGGSFDPPHVAHVLVACWARVSGDVDRVLVVPTFEHAFGKRSAPYEDRVTMCERAFGLVAGCEVSRIEEELGASRTLPVLQALHERHPGARFRLVIGTDILPDTPKWHRWDEVARLAPPLVVGRAGHEPPADLLAEHGLDALPLTMPELSSTEVRRRLGAGESVTGMVPTAVAEYVRDRGLYEVA
ncbi:MAG: nicotinate (nicotinamide) nucleotide adenylyltransferase [Sandaracinus sp.]|nr:nicotinate (nicotinamide) nucleotide adenylyltransferase [Sandaracinus sp.]|tara:strand:+ start:432 stop:1010 length:579 start_codon:yes stop_codon:yes gene_type:complete